MLEPYTGKLVRTVLREERGREASDLPGCAVKNTKIIKINLALYKEGAFRIEGGT